LCSKPQYAILIEGSGYPEVPSFVNKRQVYQVIMTKNCIYLINQAAPTSGSSRQTSVAKGTEVDFKGA
jgi:hypothetical protein